MKDARTFTAAQMRAMLAHTYEPEGQPREWAVWYEATFGDPPRRCDAVAVNLWGSRGAKIHGFEIKVTRADWLVELRDGGKAEAAWRACDEWYVVAPAGVVEPAELPVGWGLMEPARTRLAVVVPAAQRTGIPDRDFWTRMIQRLYEQQRQERAKELEEYRRAFDRRAEQTANIHRLTDEQVALLRLGKKWREVFGEYEGEGWYGEQRGEPARIGRLAVGLVRGKREVVREIEDVTRSARALVGLARRAVQLARDARALDPKTAAVEREKAERKRRKWKDAP